MSIRRYYIGESVIFRKTKEDFGGLSNMAAGFSIKVNDVVIRTSEHLYQACRFPQYPDLQWSIINEPSPMKAKWISKANLKLTRGDWDQVRFKVMQWAIEIKLSQNWNSFSNLLLSTGAKSIVEGTPKDKVWGAVQEGDYYVGTNALGRLLMYIREEYARKNQYNRCIHPLNIPNFCLLENQIGLVCNESDLVDMYADLNNNQLAIIYE